MKTKLKYYIIFSEGSRVNQIICAVLINFPVFVYGAAIGWMSPMTLLLQSENSPRDVPLTDNEVSWMGAAAYLLCVAFDLIIAIIGDKIGRKYTIFVLSAAGMLGNQAVVTAFIVARSLVGVMMAGAYVTCPLYTKEISEDVIRGMLGSMVILFHTGGNLFLYVIGDILPYYTILWICITLPIMHIVLFTLMPESPSYLVKKGKFDKAAQAIAWLRCRQQDDLVVIDELEQLKRQNTKDEECNKFVIKAIFTDKILFRAFRIALVVALAREVCGAIPVLNFAGEIFKMASEDTGLVLTANQQAMMLGAVQVVGSMATVGVVEKVGRKGLLIVTSLVSGLSMCTLASWFLARSYDLDAPAWLPIVTLCLCIFCDSFGLQPVSVILGSELFSFKDVKRKLKFSVVPITANIFYFGTIPGKLLVQEILRLKYRGTVMGATMSAASVTDFLQMLFFKPVMKNIGPYVAFYFFGAVCILATVYTVVAIPETKARTLDEIYEDLKTKKEKLEHDETETKPKEFWRQL